MTAREEGREDAGAERVGAAEIRVALAQGEDEVDVLDELDLVEVGGEGEELREEFEVVGGLDRVQIPLQFREDERFPGLFV